MDFSILLPYVVVLTWVYEGFSLKYIDLVLDHGKASKAPAIWFVAISASALSGFLMAVDPYSLSSVTALIAGLIVSGKIDHRLWKIMILVVYASLATFVLLFLDTVYLGTVLDFIMIMIVTCGGSIADEMLHDNAGKITNRFLKKFVEYRPVMKLLVFALFLALPSVKLYHFIAWILFDITYEIVARSHHHDITEREDVLLADRSRF